MIISKHGEGTAFSVGDPWLYNVCINYKKIPAEFENFWAGNELVKFLIENTRK